MRFEVLGPLSVVDCVDGQRRSLLPSAIKKRILLAALLSRAGEIVSTPSLISEIWGDRPPAKARGALHVYMAQLRNQLAQASVTDNAATIVTEGPGYALRLIGAEFDQTEFEPLLGRARSQLQHGELSAAGTTIRHALGLWRGPALAGLAEGTGTMLGVFATCLDEEYVAALELRVEIDLLLGRHREVIAELIRLVHDYPLRETFYKQLMLAFYRSERRADALNCFVQLRSRLREELGVEPCRPIQQLHQAVLSADPSLDRHQLNTAAS
ncbi:AfsR/SARP family transcriptional regulator [Saccharomonospora sp. NPDC046836]|uniref:AfsR/SARP family transcriptional regulator n=1 Tax=Saccharomonospora sp. NPDC046836 TaxID=3156921 RepID=UPI0033C256C5